MIAKIKTYPNVPKSETDPEIGDFERMIECDKVYKTRYKKSFRLLLMLNNKVVEDGEYTEKTRVFFMENGKTVDRIDFRCN